MGLMVINRVAGLVLPYTSKTLLDRVLSTQHPHPSYCQELLWSFLGDGRASDHIVFAHQLLSKAGQRLISEMRRQVQRMSACFQ